MTDPERPDHTPGTDLAVLVAGADHLVVTGVTLDSRRVRPGDLYVALPGERTHGARFVGQARQAGAAAVVTDRVGAELAAGCGIPVVVVDDPRAALAPMAAEIYGRPADSMTMLGVTGTAGKTSTSMLLAHGLEAVGRRAATIGTLGFRLGATALDLGRSTVTTPESSDLQALLAVLRERGAEAVAMEVSSHALALHRADEITFDVAGFTNLGQDHLDFHHDQESYFAVKAGLFTQGRARIAVINTDDPWGRRLAGLLAGGGRTPLVTVGASDADYRIASATRQEDGSTAVELVTPAGKVDFSLGLLGGFNVWNALVAAAMLDQLDLDLGQALTGFAATTIPGRMQRVPLGEGAPNVVVDFAHTPEAVAAALAALPEGFRIVVLGCGGDRDHGKRGPMGRAAALGADVVIVTDDNPRSEDPAAIRAQVMAGARGPGGRAGQVIDGGRRAAAIALAVEMAGPRDWVAVLGKGHEAGQEIEGRTIPFDDVEAVADSWNGKERDRG